MTQNKKSEIVFWLIFLLVIFAVLYLLSDILLPFIVAIIVAYFLDPITDKLQKLGCSRNFATISVTSIFFVISALILMLIIPNIYNQLLLLIHNVPSYVSTLESKLLPLIRDNISKLDSEHVNKMTSLLGNFSGSILNFITKFISNLWNSGMFIFNIFSLIFITPVIAFYMLRDWDIMLSKVHNLFPKKYEKTLLEQIKLMNQTLAGFLRGQTQVCLILGFMYSVALSILGLEYALFIGIATGILTFIPYVGATFGLVMGTIIAYLQFGSIISCIAVAAIFMAGQAIESAFLSPKLVGDKVGLHPIWIMFGMFAFGSLFGFVGVLIAVPLSACIGVIIKFAIGKYKKSSLYSA